MPVFAYPIRCTAAGCAAAAAFKVAARWSDGQTEELKTYGLVCGGCVGGLLAAAAAKRAACRLVPGETLDPPGVYDLHPGDRHNALTRRPDLEAPA